MSEMRLMTLSDLQVCSYFYGYLSRIHQYSQVWLLAIAISSRATWPIHGNISVNLLNVCQYKQNNYGKDAR
jgi:hypothetical protein